MLGIGIVGAGNMGSAISRAIDGGKVSARLVGLADKDQDAALGLARSLGSHPPVVSIAELAQLSDIVVEAAGPAALREVAPTVISLGKDLVVLSVSGLIDRSDWLDLAAGTGSTIHCPSGAIGSLDAVKAARVGSIESVEIRTRKPPRALEGAPYLEDRRIDLSDLSEPTTVFEGSARDACRGFPANVNVSAALSLAGIGVDRTRVTIIADPTIQHNIHEIEVVGEFGRLETTIENAPSPDNPKTSRIAALSAVALLANLTTRLKIGT